MQRSYGPLCAEVYDLTKPVGGDYPDVPYYLRRLAPIGGRVLEAAVGTGRLLVPLLRAGLRVEGIDGSTDMLAYCRRNCEAAGWRATLHQGALERMTLGARYNAIVLTFGSFMLLSGPGEAVAALDRMQHHLVPGGRLFVDVDAPRARTPRPAGGAARRVVECPDGSRIVLLDVVTREGAVDGIERHVLSYEKSRGGRVVGREVQDFPLRRYEHDDLVRVLADAGFARIEACGDYAEDAAAVTARQWLCFSAVARQ